MIDKEPQLNPQPKTTLLSLAPRRGRPKGSIGKRTLMARDTAERLNVNPLEFLLKKVKDKRLAIEVRIACARETLPYLFPRLTTTHVTASVSHDININQRMQAAISADFTLADALERMAFAMLDPASEIKEPLPFKRLGGATEDKPAPPPPAEEVL